MTTRFTLLFEKTKVFCEDTATVYRNTFLGFLMIFVWPCAAMLLILPALALGVFFAAGIVSLTPTGWIVAFVATYGAWWYFIYEVDGE